LFVVLSLLIPVLILGTLEGLLRCFGFGGYPEVVRNVGPIGDRQLCVIETFSAASYFVSNRSRPGSMFENDFLVPKPEGTFRVLFCGESAAKGFPQPRALAASSFLQAMLGDLMPDRRIEVLNIATTAIASFPVLGLLRESLSIKPD